MTAPANGGKRTTIRDVAERAGVSTATVSYVLNDSGAVSADTATRVRDCVAELGYRADGLAVAHRTGRSQTIGLAVPDLTNPFFPEFSQGVYDAASKAGFAVILVDFRGSPDDERLSLEQLTDRRPEGLIWCPVGESSTDQVVPAWLPTVVFDREIEGFDSIAADIYQGGFLQGSEVVAHGHERIGIISGPDWSETAQLRRDGVLTALGQDCEVVWEFALDYSAFIPDYVADQIRSADVTCAVTANDIQAIGLLQIFRTMGRAVPDDVSVIGFDDIALARLVSPTLTTVHLPIRRLGSRAFEMLRTRIENPALPTRREQLEVQMARRESLSLR